MDSKLSLPRCYFPSNFGPIVKQELHCFCDASVNGTGHVIYIRSFTTSGEKHLAFVSANSKIAPRSVLSIPRLELCAAVDGAIATQQIVQDLKLNPSDVFLYSDSKVVIGYLQNSSRRFSRYVTRRVGLILKSFPSSQWKYVSTDDNPGDIASRPQNLSSLSESCWFRGPAFLWLDKEPDTPVDLSPVPLPEEEPSSVVLKSSPTVPFFSDMCLRSASLKNLLGKLKVIFCFLYDCYDRACLSKGAYLARRPPLSYQMCIQSAILERPILESVETRLCTKPSISTQVGYLCLCTL